MLNPSNKREGIPHCFGDNTGPEIEIKTGGSSPIIN